MGQGPKRLNSQLHSEPRHLVETCGPTWPSHVSWFRGPNGVPCQLYMIKDSYAPLSPRNQSEDFFVPSLLRASVSKGPDNKFSKEFLERVIQESMGEKTAGNAKVVGPNRQFQSGRLPTDERGQCAIPHALCQMGAWKSVVLPACIVLVRCWTTKVAPLVAHDFFYTRCLKAHRALISSRFQYDDCWFFLCSVIMRMVWTWNA